MKPSLVSLLIVFFSFSALSQSETTVFLDQKRGMDQVIEISGSTAVVLQFIEEHTEYGSLWYLERVDDIDTMFKDQAGNFYGSNAELKFGEKNIVFNHFLNEGERPVKLKMIHDDGDINFIVNSSYAEHKKDSLEEALTASDRYFDGFGYFYSDAGWEEEVSVFMNYKLYPSAFDECFSKKANELVTELTASSPLTDSALLHLTTMTPTSFEAVYDRLPASSWESCFTHRNVLVNQLAVQNPALFCSWVEQTKSEKRWIYTYANRDARKSLKAFDTDSPVKKELLKENRKNVAEVTTGFTLALSFYGGIGVGIANLIALYR